MLLIRRDPLSFFFPHSTAHSSVNFWVEGGRVETWDRTQVRGRRVTRHNDIKLESAFSKDKQEPAIQIVYNVYFNNLQSKSRSIKIF